MSHVASISSIDALRCRRLAQLYTASSPATGLTETVRMVARSVGFPAAQVNVVDGEYSYTIAQWDGDDVLGGHWPFRPLPSKLTMCQFTAGSGKLLTSPWPARPCATWALAAGRYPRGHRPGP